MPKMTKEELVAYLDAKIRMHGRWKFQGLEFGDGPVGALTGEANTNVSDKQVLKVAAKIYDSIIEETDYSETCLEATRAVKKFNVAYVVKVLKRAIKDGLFEESRQAGMVIDALEEHFDGKKLIRK